MNGAAPAVSLRESARQLPLNERARRFNTVRSASAGDLLRAVHAAAVGAGEWKSAHDAAANVFVVNERTMRRWLTGSEPIPLAVHHKLYKLAWAFGVEISQP
jgi:hypothetical protein